MRGEGTGAKDWQSRPSVCPLPTSSASCLGVGGAINLPSLAAGRSWGCPGSAACGAGARVNQKLRFWGRGSPCRPHSRAAAPVRGHYAFPSTPPAAGLPALHAGDEGFHNPAQTGLKRNTQVNKSRPRNAGRAVQGVDPPGRWVRRGLRGCGSDARGGRHRTGQRRVPPGEPLQSSTEQSHFSHVSCSQTAPVRGKELLPVISIEILVPVVSRQALAGWHRART